MRAPPPSSPSAPPAEAGQAEAAGPGPAKGAPVRKSPLRRLVMSLLRITILSYIGITALLYFFQSKFVYQPTAEIVSTPGDFGMNFEDVQLTASDGLSLHAWYVHADRTARGVVLFCHGNAGNISHRIDSLFLWRDLGMDVLIFDYRGYGRSQGTPSEAGTHRDARAAWDYLIRQRQVPPERIVLYGRSLGGAMAAPLAADVSPAGLILESTFTSIPDLGSDLYWFLPVRWLARFQYNTLEAVRKVRCPLLVVHSQDDDLIPFSHGKRLFDAAGQPKTFHAMRGGHNEGWMLSLHEGYQRALDAFCAKCLTARPNHGHNDAETQRAEER